MQLTCRIETTRHVSSITIILSTVPLDTSAPGYQAPLPEDQVKEHVPSAVTSPTAGTVEPPRGMHELVRSFVLFYRGLRTFTCDRPTEPCAPLRLVRQALVGVVLRVVLAEARGAEEEGGVLRFLTTSPSALLACLLGGSPLVMCRQEGAGELAPEGSVVGEGEAPVQQVSQVEPLCMLHSVSICSALSLSLSSHGASRLRDR